MMSRSTRRGLLLAGLLAGTTFWLTRDGDGGPEGPIEGLDTRLDYALENFDMRAYDEQGAPALRLWAPRLTNEAATNIGRVENPRLQVRHEGFLWNIMAEMAVISDDQEEVFLGGMVRLERDGDTPAQRMDIDSRNVTLLVESRIARSPESVRLADPAGELRARGFQVDMLNNEFHLENDVEGVYVLPQ